MKKIFIEIVALSFVAASVPSSFGAETGPLTTAANQADLHCAEDGIGTIVSYGALFVPYANGVDLIAASAAAGVNDSSNYSANLKDAFRFVTHDFSIAALDHTGLHTTPVLSLEQLKEARDTCNNAVSLTAQATNQNAKPATLTASTMTVDASAQSAKQ